MDLFNPEQEQEPSTRKEKMCEPFIPLIQAHPTTHLPPTRWGKFMSNSSQLNLEQVSSNKSEDVVKH